MNASPNTQEPSISNFPKFHSTHAHREGQATKILVYVSFHNTTSKGESQTTEFLFSITYCTTLINGVLSLGLELPEVATSESKPVGNP